VTQSRAARSEASVSLKPNPSGLTTPAATTATRAVNFSPFALEDPAIFNKEKLIAISIAFLKEAF
jgi:hypothetical protein